MATVRQRHWPRFVFCMTVFRGLASAIVRRVVLSQVGLPRPVECRSLSFGVNGQKKAIVPTRGGMGGIEGIERASEFHPSRFRLPRLALPTLSSRDTRAS